MIFFFYISVIVLLFGVPFTEGRLSKIPKRYDSNLNIFQPSNRDEHLKLDSTGMFSDNSDPFSSFNLNIPTESALNILNHNKPSNTNNVPVKEPKPAIGGSFITTTGVDKRPGENVFSPGLNNKGTKLVNKVDSRYGAKEGEKNNLRPTKEKNDTVKTLIAKKILFQAKPVVPVNELDDSKTDIIYYIE